MKVDMLWFLAIPSRIKRGYEINSYLRHSQRLLSEGSFLEALKTSRQAVAACKDKIYDARMFEGIALASMKLMDEAGQAFNWAIELIEKEKELSTVDKAYLRIYCYSYFKNVKWPTALQKSPIFPEIATFQDVSEALMKKYPLNFRSL